MRDVVLQALDVVRLGHALAWTIPGMSRTICATGMPHCSSAELLEVALAKNGSHDKGTWIGTAIAEEPLKHILATPCSVQPQAQTCRALRSKSSQKGVHAGMGCRGWRLILEVEKSASATPALRSLLRLSRRLQSV